MSILQKSAGRFVFVKGTKVKTRYVKTSLTEMVNETGRSSKKYALKRENGRNTTVITYSKEKLVNTKLNDAAFQNLQNEQ